MECGQACIISFDNSQEAWEIEKYYYLNIVDEKAEA